MSRAFISWIGAFGQDVFGPYGKLATIFFDQLIFRVPRADTIEGVLDSLVAQNEIRYADADQLRQIWTPVQAVLPDYHFLKKSPWEHENERLLEIAHSVTVDSTLEQYPGIDKSEPAGFAHEVSWAGAGLIEAITTWTTLHAAEPCTYLAEPRESWVVQQIFQEAQPPEAVELFRHIAESRVPDLSLLTWERVLELRHHAFLENFRQKVTELSISFRSNNEGAISEGIRELELQELRELARLVQPAPRTMILKSIASNIPLPIPINPVSIGIAVKELKEAYDRKERFGWLYFLMELSGS
jgi:hypothetical protein